MKISHLGVLLIACACSSSYSQIDSPSDLAQRVPIAPAYGGSADETHNDDADIPNKIISYFHCDFSVAFEWSVGVRFTVEPDFGTSPIAYEYASDESSYIYSYGQTPQVLRNSQFRDVGMMAIEQIVSPLPIIRVLRSGRFDNSKWTIEEIGPTTVLEIRRDGSALKDRYSFDTQSWRLLVQQAYGANGKVAMERRFEDWVPVGSKGEAPTRIEYILPDMAGVRIYSTTIISDLKELDVNSPPRKAAYRSDATIVDLIEGVTKRADGTVLGEIAPVPTSAGAGNPIGQSAQKTISQNARLFMFVGVGLILLAGVVLGVRRWKSG